MKTLPALQHSTDLASIEARLAAAGAHLWPRAAVKAYMKEQYCKQPVNALLLLLGAAALPCAIAVSVVISFAAHALLILSLGLVVGNWFTLLVGIVAIGYFIVPPTTKINVWCTSPLIRGRDYVHFEFGMVQVPDFAQSLLGRILMVIPNAKFEIFYFAKDPIIWCKCPGERRARAVLVYDDKGIIPPP